MLQVRPLDAGDGGSVEAIDRADAARAGRAPVATRGALAFYGRSGHSFVAWGTEEPRGFALAQAVWDGARATVRVATLALADPNDDEARTALLEAVTKSAYDAAVYELVFDVADDEAAMRRLLQAHGWRAVAARPFRRTLGTGGTA